jgi:multicomponent Na+:H+ antiporter subunit D
VIDWNAHLAALQVIVPMFTVPLVVLLRPSGLAWSAAMAASIGAFAVSVALTLGVLDGQIYSYSQGSWPAPYGIELRVDAFSAIVLLLVTGTSSLALLAARTTLDAEIEAHRQPFFYSAWLLVLTGLTGILVSADAFNIFVFMEIAALASYVLVAGGKDRRALPAVFTYLVMGTIGATFYLVGVGLIYMMTGTLNLADMESRIHQVADQTPIMVAAGFITVGLALKAAVFPLHAWLPNAYTYAPHAVTVFLAACSAKVVLYLLLRFDFFVFQANLASHDIQFSWFFLPLAVLALLIGSGIALFENNIKRMLAYSSVAQIGYILIGAGLVNVAGLTASVLYMFNHALAKGGLFLAVACLAMRCTGLTHGDIRGAARDMPWTMAAFVVAGLSLIGMPGTAGFVSKWYLLSAVLEQGLLGILLAIVIVLSSLMSVVYIWRVVEAAYFQPPTSGTATHGEAPPLLLAATWTAVLANVYFGLNPALPVALSSAAAKTLLGHVP